MRRLGARDWQLLSEFLRGAYSCRDPGSLRTYLVSALSSIIPCEIAGYAEIRVDVGQSQNWFWPAEAHDRRRDELWERHMSEHPVLEHVLRTGQRSPLKISDFLTRRQFRQRGLYCDVYRPMGVEDALVITERSGPLLLGLAAHRGRRDFSERDRTLMIGLQRHMLQAYRNASTAARLEQDLSAARAALDALDQGIVLVQADGRVRLATTVARRQLREYFGHRSGRGLPEPLRRWMRQSDIARGAPAGPAPSPLEVQRAGKRLVVRSAPALGHMVLVLEERPTEFDPHALAPLRLTPREADVLAWVAQGKRNGEIAIILDMTLRTVEKHLERILEKLGVETRTAAAATALRLLLPR